MALSSIHTYSVAGDFCSQALFRPSLFLFLLWQQKALLSIFQDNLRLHLLYSGEVSHVCTHQTLLSTALVNVIAHCWLSFCKGESSLYSHIQPHCVGAQTHLSIIFLTLLWLETRRHLYSASIQPAERHKRSLSQITQWLQKHLQEPHTWITEEGGRREKQNVTILCSLLDFLQRNGLSSLLKPYCSLL